MHNKVKPCFQFHLLHTGPLKLQKEKSAYFGCSRRIVRCHKTCVACLSPQLHWEGGCIWWWLLAGRSSQSVTKAALKHLLLCCCKWMVMENQLCPTFCACWAHCSSAHGWFIFWKAFKQSSYVCSHTYPPEKQNNSSVLEPHPSYPCWTTWGIWDCQGSSGVFPDCGTSMGHVFQSAEHAIKPRQRQWKGAGNPGMPFLKQTYPHHSSKRLEGFAATAQKWGPG